MWSQPSKPGPEKSGIIRHGAEVPPGELLEDILPTEWRARFAVLREGSSEHCTVLVTPDAYGGVAMFDVRRRLQAADIQQISFLQASAEIIKLLRDQRQTYVPAGLHVDDATGIEKTALDLIETALLRGASDIHIETRVDHAAVFLRINGQRQLLSHISIESANGLGVVLYSVHADASSKDITWDPMQVMDGVIEHRRANGQQIQLRFSSAPIFPTGNFHVVIRLLRMESSKLNLDDLGYSESQQRWLERASGTLSGLLLFCGPTNSGKSTSLQALMQSLYRLHGDSVKTITVEDPVEYVVEGACQISVPRRQRQSDQSPFTRFLRGTLRQDPDIVMIGEIRDHESASVAKDLVLAGRKVLTTLHTYSALWAFLRLRELGLPIELLTMPGFISGIVYQRLVPLLCPHCAIPAEGQLDDLQMQRITPWLLPGNQLSIRGNGCAHCQQSGIIGRTICAEIVQPDAHLLSLMASQRHAEAEQYWQQHNPVRIEGLGVTALNHGIDKLRQGLIDPRDLERYAALLPEPTTP